MNNKNKKYWAIGLIILIIAISSSYPFLAAKLRLNAEIASLRKVGLPTTPREFADKYYKPIPKEENAATVFNTALPLFKKDKNFYQLIIVGLAEEPRFDQKISPILLPMAQDFINQNIDFLKAIEKVQKYDRVHFDYDWGNKYYIDQPRLNKIRNIVKVYAVETELIINQNAPEKASELLKKMFHIAKLTSQSPFMLSKIVFYACDSMTLHRLERCMNTLTFSPEQLKDFEKKCTEHEPYIITQWSNMWKLELTCILSWTKIDISKSYIAFSPYESEPYIKNLPKKYRVALYYYSGGYINDMICKIKSSKAMMNVPVDICTKRKAELEQIRDDNKPSKNFELFPGSMIPLYLKTIEMVARLRCAKTACAVERFRLKYKYSPKNLKQLVPEFLAKVPIDPFDGKPLRYFRGKFDVQYKIPLAPNKKAKVSEKNDVSPELTYTFTNYEKEEQEFKYKSLTLKKKGFYVYSIGRDLKDDKALALETRLHLRKDVLFIVVDK